MGLFWLLILGLIITLIWFLIQKGAGSSQSSNDDSPLDIVKKRYARGEINEEEYRKMKKEIDQ